MIPDREGSPPLALMSLLALLLSAISLQSLHAQHVSEPFDWMPPESVDPAARAEPGTTQIIPEILVTQTPKATADVGHFNRKYVLELGRFKISNAGKKPVATAQGINAALQHAKTRGANRIVFPKGTYLISETVPIVFDHEDTIVDLNESTLQIRTNAAPRYGLVEIVDGAENFRLTNGTLRGDRATHDMKATKSSFEGCSLLKVFSGRDLEIDHLTLTGSPGSCISTRATGSRTRPELLAMIMASVRVGNLEPGAFSKSGRKVRHDRRIRTAEPYDARSCGGEFEFGCGALGYQGYPYIKNRVYQVLFYDKSRALLQRKTCLQYKKIAVPEHAQWMHFEFNQPEVAGEAKVTVGRITNFRPPREVHFHDNHIVGNRTLGMAYCGGQRWLIESNRFERNGPDVVGWGVDLEDGWELMQHVVFRNNVFKGNLRGDLVICAGSELLFEGNRFDGNVAVHGRPHNYVFRNNHFTGGHVGYKTRTGIARIHDNTYRNCTLSITFDTKAVADGLYRKPGETVATPPLTLTNERLINVSRITGTYFDFHDAKISNSHFIVGDTTALANFKRCRFRESTIEYEAGESKVSTAFQDCTGMPDQTGPGLKRRKPVMESTKAKIRINAKFPGGNVLVQENAGTTVHIAPDLRGGRPWFYWYFEAEVLQPGRVAFVFPPDAGAQIGVNGPAVSFDRGKTWSWMGVDDVQYRNASGAPSDAFSYEFTARKEKVRFSVGIPYLLENLDAFTARVGRNSHLTRSVLARSLQGRPVALWRIGRPRAGVTPVLVSARHHACEALASYVLEGFLEEASSDSPSGEAFRRKYVLYAVPIVDVDGVAEGDQGKGRRPHDHNRDYGQLTMRYPPVRAMVELAKKKGIRLALDFHCPTLRMDIHQGFYFAGTRLPHIEDNMDELIAWLDDERPPAVTGRERDLLNRPASSAPSGGRPFSDHFADQDGVYFAATLECPYTQRGNGLDGPLAREYGRGLLRAWVRTEFVSPQRSPPRSEWDSAKFFGFRKAFTAEYRRKPGLAEAAAKTFLGDEQAPSIYRIEASNLMGMLRFRQRKYDEALEFFAVAMAEERATAQQRAIAASARCRIVCADPGSSLRDLSGVLRDFSAISYPSSKQRAAVHEAAARAYEERKRLDPALTHAQSWFTHASRYDRGKALNRVADILERRGQKNEAIATRQRAVAILRQELDPVPVGVFGPLMAADLLDALNGIPTATVAEKKAAAAIALNHEVRPPSLVRRIQEGLRGIE